MKLSRTSAKRHARVHSPTGEREASKQRDNRGGRGEEIGRIVGGVGIRPTIHSSPGARVYETSWCLMGCLLVSHDHQSIFEKRERLLPHSGLFGVQLSGHRHDLVPPHSPLALVKTLLTRVDTTLSKGCSQGLPLFWTLGRSHQDE